MDTANTANTDETNATNASDEQTSHVTPEHGHIMARALYVSCVDCSREHVISPSRFIVTPDNLLWARERIHTAGWRRVRLTQFWRCPDCARKYDAQHA